MYESFFNLEMKPFDLTPNPQFLYMSKTHQRAMNYLQYGFTEQAGFILLTGDIGAGKTTLIRELINQLENRAVIARVFNTQIDSAQLLGLVNMDFGLDIKTLDKTVLLKNLNEFLIGCYARNERPLLIIDEAQNLSIEVLEEIRLLSNLESENVKLLQIIMVGQPELKTLLGRNSLKQLRQRLSVSCHLGPLSKDETREYFYHRLECAGNKSAVQVPEQMFTHMHKSCKGIPRLINILGDYLLLTAYNDQRKQLSGKYIRDLIKEVTETVAFSESHNLITTDLPGNRTDRDPGLESLDSQLAVLDKNLDQEEILRIIIRKQFIQMDRLQDQLDAIGTSIHQLEQVLKEMAVGAKHKKIERDSLKHVQSKVN